MSSVTEYLLVDGYNIIFAWDTLKTVAEESLENARIKLVEILSDFQGSTGVHIIVVFDAHKVKDGRGAAEQHGNIQVVYTREAETADSYIEQTAHKLLKDAPVRVATGDVLEQIIILSRGARRLSAARLLEEVETAKRNIRQKYTENRPIKQNMLSDILDQKTAQVLERMRQNTAE